MNFTNKIVRTNNNEVNSLIFSIPANIHIYLGIFLLLMGNIGCFGNLLIYQTRTFRHQAFSIYIICETLSDFLVLNFILLTRILENGFHIPLEHSYTFLCKFREFGEYYFCLCSFTFFTLASIDRILSAQRSNTFRKWSNRVSLAYKMILISILFWFFILFHRFIVFEIIDNDCDPTSNLYDIIDHYLEAILLEIIPLIIVFILVFLLRRSLKTIVEHQINIISNKRQQTQLQNIDSQLTLMLLLQSIIAIISFLPYGCRLLYKQILHSYDVTSLYRIIDHIIGALTRVLSFTFFASSFYISLISNNGFRRKIKRLFRNNEIRPFVCEPVNILHNEH
ncbi:unnamed protein product [Adineta ricciae]|uniref:G-protein coupled receptors family 1 profile domain-containing protein n=1 Tax=Adineta ricciae TaxID=249248 RepID=A0A815GG34_ADIRI|nr:unnamed protein product [Adineta ricciae]CAF1583595.1 unnamed protein product [Adineta ricciae]